MFEDPKPDKACVKRQDAADHNKRNKTAARLRYRSESTVASAFAEISAICRFAVKSHAACNR